MATEQRPVIIYRRSAPATEVVKNGKVALPLPTAAAGIRGREQSESFRLLLRLLWQTATKWRHQLVTNDFTTIKSGASWCWRERREHAFSCFVGPGVFVKTRNGQAFSGKPIERSISSSTGVVSIRQETRAVRSSQLFVAVVGGFFASLNH